MAITDKSGSQWLDCCWNMEPTKRSPMSGVGVQVTWQLVTLKDRSQRCCSSAGIRNSENSKWVSVLTSTQHQYPLTISLSLCRDCQSNQTGGEQPIRWCQFEQVSVVEERLTFLKPKERWEMRDKRWDEMRDERWEMRDERWNDSDVMWKITLFLYVVVFSCSWW